MHTILLETQTSISLLCNLTLTLHVSIFLILTFLASFVVDLRPGDSTLGISSFNFKHIRGEEQGAGARENRGREGYGRREGRGQKAEFPKWREPGEKEKNFAILRNIL